MNTKKILSNRTMQLSGMTLFFTYNGIIILTFQNLWFGLLFFLYPFFYILAGVALRLVGSKYEVDFGSNFNKVYSYRNSHLISTILTTVVLITISGYFIGGFLSGSLLFTISNIRKEEYHKELHKVKWNE